MEFSKKKLPKEAIGKLFRMKIESLQPYALMLAPVYLYFKANEKFVAVKAPLDFFTDSELLKLKDKKYFYFSEFVRVVLPFRAAGTRVRRILSFQHFEVVPTEKDPYPEVSLPPAPFELSDLVLKSIGPIWWGYREGVGVDPFLVTVFVNELCDLIPADHLLEAREKYIENYDLALYRASWAVFLALTLGHCDLSYLHDLRMQVFDQCIKGTPFKSSGSELDELISVAYATMNTTQIRIIQADAFRKRPERVSLKVAARLERVKKEMMSVGSKEPSIYGIRGFIDV